MKYVVEIQDCDDKAYMEVISRPGTYTMDNVWVTDESDNSYAVRPYRIRFSQAYTNLGFVVGYATSARRDEVYRQLQAWMSELYKCSIVKDYLSVFAANGGDIIFRFPVE